MNNPLASMNTNTAFNNISALSFHKKPTTIHPNTPTKLKILSSKFAKLGSEMIGGKGGGGRKDFAQAGGQDQNKIDEAFEKIKGLI